MNEFDAINRDVWVPFQQSYAALDIELFARVHDPGSVRVESAGRWLGGLAASRGRTAAGFERARTRGDAVAIEFRFTDRVLGDGLAHERGVYRVTVTAPDGRAQVFHGRFHTVHRRSGETWRLLFDLDVDDGPPADDAAFMDAHPQDHTAAFDSDVA